MKLKILIICSITVVMIMGCAKKVSDPLRTNNKKQSSGINKKNMDLNIKPGNDFFRYANGGYLATLEIPADKSSYNVFTELREKAEKDINDILKEISEIKDAAPGTAAQQIRDFYSTGMDIAKINTEGISPLNPEIEKINNINNQKDLLDVVVQMHLHGLDPFFGGGVSQDLMDNSKYSYYLAQSGLGLPDVSYYTSDEERPKEIRTEYVKHIAKMFVLAGKDEETAANWAQKVFDIELFLAQNSKTRMEMRNIPALYNPTTIEKLQKQSKNFDWESYFKKLSQHEFKSLIVMSPKFFVAMDELLGSTSIDDLKVYLKWNLLNSTANFLSDDFVNQDFAFYQKFLSGNEEIQERWKRVTQMTNGTLGELLGQLYVEKYFPPSSKEKMEKLVANLKTAMKKRIENLSWMSDETKQEALAKLASMKVKVGYPDKWEDYSKLEIKRDSYIANIRRASYFAIQKNLEKYTKPIDPDEWPFTPQTVNAGYSPIKNDITFPAGILQPPYFNPEADDAVNYGAIGVVIGHEMTHGFDDQGRNFDKNGNMKNWWKEEDAQKFKEITQLLVDQYSQFKATEDVYVDGNLSLGENIADFGGLTISLEAYKMSLEGKKAPAKIDGFNNMQRFFLSYATIWRGKIRKKALIRKVKEDVHPWGEYRVNGALFNVPEFYETFNISKDDALYRTPEQRPVIW